MESVRGHLDENEIFSVFIHEESMNWNHALIDATFVSKETEFIKKLPLSRFGAPDRLI